MKSILYKVIKNTLGKIKYRHLLFLKEHGSDLIYYKLLQLVFKISSFLIGRCKKKIKVTFLVYLENSWSGEYLYRYLEKDSRFDVKIGIIKFSNRIDEYVRVKNYFAKSHEIFTVSSNSRELIDTDILIYTTTSNWGIPAANQLEYSILTLSILMPYTFWLDEYSDKLFEETVSQCFWKFYCPSAIHTAIGRRKCDVGKLNMVFSGYPKMDHFYNSSTIEVREMLWKEDKKEKVRIIYAPGIVSTDSTANFSTFMENAMWIYEYAKSHLETTSWIYRPHPYLAKSLEDGQFMKREEYEAYERGWRELPNANVICGGDYYDIFISSDGMILDSISFVSGYQYTGKPLLFLEKSSPEYNLYGDKIMRIVYRSKGDDWSKIQDFIEHVLVEKQDYMYEKRKRFFRKYLDYKTFNKGVLASEYIFRDIVRSLGK